MEEPLIRYEGVEIKQQELTVLRNVDLEVRKGEFLYVMGKVGSGKSSFLKTVYAELPVVAGKATVMGYDLRKIRQKHVPALRKKLGIVFQDFRLLTDRSVYDNLYFVLRATGWKEKVQINRRIEDVLKLVGMENKGYKFPNELSGGEQQRVAIARTLAQGCKIILADEPTGNLDTANTANIVAILKDLAHTDGCTVIIVTHDPAVAEEADTVLQMKDGSFQ